MKYLKQFGVILTLSFAGELLHHIIPAPIPASIYGIVLLFAGLEWKIIPLSAVRETGKFLITIMPVMFIPAAVGLMESWGILQSHLVPYLVITAVSTIVVMAAAGLVTQTMIRREKRRQKS